MEGNEINRESTTNSENSLRAEAWRCKHFQSPPAIFRDCEVQYHIYFFVLGCFLNSEKQFSQFVLCKAL